jgi:hypothetical protein
MCDHFPPPRPIPETRRSFLLKVAGASVAAGILGASRAAAAQETQPQVGHSGWARLITANRHWNIHRDQDTILGGFIRGKTRLKLDPTCYSVSPANMERLCAFPFIFSNNLAAVSSPEELQNLSEYLYRGGFIYIDGCVNVGATPNFREFFRAHGELFSKLVPGSERRLVPASHPVFQACFQVQESVLLHGTPNGAPIPMRDAELKGLFGVYDDDRMVMLLSLEHLLCGWPQNSEWEQVAMREIANIYAYSRAR